MPPNLSVRPTPVLLSDKLNFTVSTGLPNSWIPDASGRGPHDKVYADLIGLIVFCLVAFFWSMFGIYLVVMGNLEDRRLKAQAELLEGLRLKGGSSDDEVQVATKVASPRKSSPRGLDLIREYDDRWFRE